MFKLEIRTGNDAMDSSDDVADALHKLADQLADHMGALDGLVRDANGNTVGEWTLTLGEAPFGDLTDEQLLERLVELLNRATAGDADAARQHNQAADEYARRRPTLD